MTQNLMGPKLEQEPSDFFHEILTSIIYHNPVK